MKTRKWKDVRDEHFTAEEQAELRQAAEREVLRMNLRELRKLLGITQAKLSELAGMTQSEVSRVERRPDVMISTLRQIVTALGGRLVLTAEYENRTVKLALPPAEKPAPQPPPALQPRKAPRRPHRRTPDERRAVAT